MQNPKKRREKKKSCRNHKCSRRHYEPRQQVAMSGPE